MRYAIIDNGVVTNITLANEPRNDSWVEATAGAAIGGTWDGSTFGPAPAPNISIERASMVCTRHQGKLAIGPELWAQVEALITAMDADAVTDGDKRAAWALRVAVYDTQRWGRLERDMQVLAWALNLTDAQVDDLFRLAMTL